MTETTRRGVNQYLRELGVFSNMNTEEEIFLDVYLFRTTTEFTNCLYFNGAFQILNKRQKEGLCESIPQEKIDLLMPADCSLSSPIVKKQEGRFTFGITV